MNQPKSLSAAELLKWGDREARRRRRSRGLLGTLTPLSLSAILSVGLGLLLWRRMVSAQAASSGMDGSVVVDSILGMALAAIAFAQIIVVFGTPYRMYWRRDSALLARLPVPGSALFQVAVVRTLRAAAIATLPALAAVLSVAVIADLSAALRLALVAAASATLAGLLSPAACLLGGAIVASDKAQALIDSFGGEVRAPRVTWLGALPGLVGTAIGLFAIGTPSWIVGGPSGAFTGWIAVAAMAVSAVGLGWAWRRADTILLAAQREVAALDQERLATIERSQAGPIEAMWAGIFCRDLSSLLVYRKDAALMRRRYPAPYFVAFLAIALAWIFAASELDTAAIVTVATLAVYSLFMARRHSMGPVEQPRLLRSLALGAPSVRRAKQAATILRALLWVGVPGLALIVFVDDLVVSLTVTLLAMLFALVGGAALSVERSHG